MSTPWKCTACGYTVKEEQPPEKCPACKQTCAFVDKTDYTQPIGEKKGDDRI